MLVQLRQIHKCIFFFLFLVNNLFICFKFLCYMDWQSKNFILKFFQLYCTGNEIFSTRSLSFQKKQIASLEVYFELSNHK